MEQAVSIHNGKPQPGDRRRAEADLNLEETIRRLRACWNACAGIPTAALEAGVVGELVEALTERVAGVLREPHTIQHRSTSVQRACAVLAKAKGVVPMYPRRRDRRL
jgi:hypothetical protein